MEYIIIRKQANSLSTNAVRVGLYDGQEYRATELIVRSEADVDETITQRLNGLWNKAAPITRLEYHRAERLKYVDRYRDVLLTVQNALDNDSSLDMTLAAGLAAIGQNATLAARFNKWRLLNKLDGANLETDQAKRDLLSLIDRFCLKGLMGL